MKSVAVVIDWLFKNLKGIFLDIYEIVIEGHMVYCWSHQSVFWQNSIASATSFALNFLLET